MSNQVIVKNPRMYAFVLMLSGFMGLFNDTSLNMALTDIMSDFQISASTVQWLTTGYLLTMACLVPASSYLLKWFSTKKLIITGIVLSLVGVLVGGIAPNFILLMIGRVIQAIGTGILIPIMMTVLMLIFPIQKRGAIMGIMGLVITAGPALGPTLSGFIISASNWHFIFWFSAVLYAIILAFSFKNVENVGTLTKPKIDIFSIFLSTIGFATVIFAFSSMAESQLTSTVVWLPLLIGVISLVTFSIRQFKISSPMLDLRAFKYRMFILGAIMVLLTVLLMLAVSILLPLYLRGALLFSSVIAGLILLPGNAVNVIFAPIVGSLFDRFGARYFGILGFILMLISAIIYTIIVSATTSAWLILTVFMLLFLGITMVMMPAQTNALNQLPQELYADGSAIIATIIQVGASAGTAIAITVYTAGMNAFEKSNPNTANEIILSHGIKVAFIYMIILTVVGLVLSLFVKKENI
ncbi:DHA2 family efflux MFS transporter permease subunit [Staphylococcus xylosus]|uniref:DHA2 family efflux MFS transporter permease subunit n=1 Tax=Staphylococcus xylosus TaxID=1288 RepID=UPI003F5790A7